MNSNKTKRVIVGMSGGVDSSVSAHILMQQGYQVEGLFMKNWEEDDTDEYCSAAQDVADAQAVCDKLGIVLHTINFAAEYWDNVFEYFLQEYQSGRTPNPDVMCNKEIKFKAFLDYAIHLGADYIATGHYVRRNDVDGKVQLLKGLDGNKDQSYFLYTLNQDQLSRSLFPVGDLEKPQVRAIAEQLELINADKKDSTGICFIGERRFKDFLSQYLPAQPGAIETEDGRVVGEHQGLMFHTLGQRKGLMIGGRADSDETPWYVIDKDMQRNVLLVGQGHDHPKLLSRGLKASQLHWVAGAAPSLSFNCTAKTRYRQQDVECHVTLDATQQQAEVSFTQLQRAITPGQSVVFYQDDLCLGGAIIDERVADRNDEPSQ